MSRDYRLFILNALVISATAGFAFGWFARGSAERAVTVQVDAFVLVPCGPVSGLRDVHGCVWAPAAETVR